MSQIQTIFKNMSWLLISQIIGCICAFIWTILMARYLGVAEYGIFGFATSLTGILIVTDDLGMFKLFGIFLQIMNLPQNIWAI